MTRKVIKQPIDQESKLNKSGQMIVDIAHRQLQVLIEKMGYEELDDKDIRKFETLTRVIQSQQKHAIDIEKLQSSAEVGNHQHIHITEDKIKEIMNGEAAKERLKEVARGG